MGRWDSWACRSSCGPRTPSPSTQAIEALQTVSYILPQNSLCALHYRAYRMFILPHTYMSVTHATTPGLLKPSCAGFYHGPRVALPHISPLLTAPSLYPAWVGSSEHITRCPAHFSLCSVVYRVHLMASGSLWLPECPRSPLRSASSTHTSSRRLPSLSSDCPSTTASWAEG